MITCLRDKYSKGLLKVNERYKVVSAQGYGDCLYVHLYGIPGWWELSRFCRRQTLRRLEDIK